MAKQVEDVVTDDRVESLKTVKFGGYDKASVDYYIDELKEKHNKEVEELKANVNKLSEAVHKVFDLRPAAIIKNLDLRRPQYRQLAAYGHMGREDLGVKWESTDRADALKAAVAE